MIVAVILAGGAARRMGGGDKPLLVLGGKTLLARIHATLAPDHAHIALSANGDPARFAAAGLPVLADATPGQGPLGGVLAGLEWAAALGARWLLTVPGDTPFIPAGLSAALAPGPSVAVSAGRTHHLVALWPTDCAGALRAWLAQDGTRAVSRFAERLQRSAVPFDGDPFCNVNTPEDLAAAARRLSGCPAAPAL